MFRMDGITWVHVQLIFCASKQQHLDSKHTNAVNVLDEEERSPVHDVFRLSSFPGLPDESSVLHS